MLYLDKAREDNSIIVTVSEMTDSLTDLSMNLYSHFTKKNYSIELGENESLYTERYDRFSIPLASFQSFEDGVYVYSITEQNQPDKSLELGYLKIVGGTQPEEYVNLDINEEDDDYIVYEY